ncbi:clasp N terminal-domain-containing protein [Mycena belliarum]|uniref:Clasp N terminal-domain-containing protein n=1 Tax=Mycena belliarum TaxID=1033014 RepID=A0AAD6XXG3_9AGAR|nr:clasp N terminal-domain-containing protein [Mycena belliae]
MDSDDTRLENLISQCRNNDVDIKVDALSKLQAEFESGIEINDPDGLIQVLKTCLRTSNQHLTTATLSVLPPLLPLLIAPALGNTQVPNALSQSSSSVGSLAAPSVVDTATLRQVLVAFLPSGGLIERLGDKERAQLKARETLVILGGLAFRSNVPSSTMSTKSRDGKGPETPLMIFERHLRETGLASKVWKVREQSILTLVHIRRAQQQFPIRAYLSQLVDTLEDTDAHVRDCARQSVIELFTGAGVSDAARADLKKEMSKKNVRKTIVDAVLSKLLGLGGSTSGSTPQSREGSENGDTTMKPKDYVPPSVALAGRRPTASSTTALSRTASVQSNISRPPSRAAPLESPSGSTTPAGDGVDIRPVYVASSRDLETEFAAMHKPFEGKENEHNWADRERAIQRVRGMLKGEIHLRYPDAFMGSLKDFIQLSLKTLASLRTTVATNTCSLYAEMAMILGTSLDPFCDTLLTNLLRMAGVTKKLTAQQSQASVSAIIEHTSTPPRVLLPLLWQTLQEKIIQARAFVVAHLKLYLELHGHRSKHTIETSGGLEIMEKSLKKALADANPAVRDTARICFWVFEGIWPDRGVALLGGLDSVARKQLEKVCPNPELAAAVIPSTPKPMKKSSVAAAIAASRAKAKAIATAPPTLRHQATASSHTVPVKRAGSPSLSTSRNSVARPSSPLRMSSSPPSHKSRIVSKSVPRSPSAEAVTTSHTRTTSGSPPSPPSPSEQTAFRRRTSSPLVSVGVNPNRSTMIRNPLKATHPAPPSTSSDPVAPTPRNGRNMAVPVHVRNSTLFAQPHMADESLLLAQTVPIPGSDSDSESMDHSVNLMSFSAAFEKYASPARRSNSQAQSFSPEASNALSSGSLETAAGQPIVEDALRARAEQAESAAERLLELVDPDDDSMLHSTIPSSLLVGTNGNGSKVKVKPMPPPIRQIQTKTPVTPVNRSSTIMRQAAQFKNSPAFSGHTSLMDVLHDQRHQTGWWLKRRNLVAQGTPLRAVVDVDRINELESYIAMLENDDVDVRVLQKLALLAIENPITEPASSPLSPDYPASPSPFVNPSRSLPSLQSDMWGKNKNFERLFDALLSFLHPAKSEEELEYGLIVVWELIENQSVHIEGREADVFSLLLRIRYCCYHNVLEATNTIRDALTTRIEPVYGLTTMHASLRSFSAEACPPTASEEVKASSYAFGLIALGKFILRLPAEIAEEELPRLRGTLISALNDKSSLVIRESAAAAIISAQLALRDETHLFALLDGLADEKKNLLTYLFDKHGARSATASRGPSGVDKLEKEMRRLDTRTSTPPRPPT